MRNDRLFLEDIVESIDRIDEFLAGLGAETFAADEKTKAAVLHKLAVVGEAARHLRDTLASRHPEVDWSKAAALNQQGCRFAPDVLLVKKDADLTIRNSDPVLHNIHTYEIIGAVRRTMFNVGQPDKGDMKQPVKMRRANVVKIECDAPDFMHAWSFAADNPYATVTKEDGSFAIDGLPEGKHSFTAMSLKPRPIV
jgi:hypothetical protein